MLVKRLARKRGNERASVSRGSDAIVSAALLRRLGLLVVVIMLSQSALVRAATIPYPVFAAVNGRVVGWAPTGRDWFVVYLDRRGRDPCGLDHASWWMALVETEKLPMRVSVAKRISGAMCGNELAWVRTGRFSDGRHQEVAFMLWTDPAIGATTYIYRIVGGRFQLLAKFGGDRVTLTPGKVTVSFENRGRSMRGEIEDIYRFERGHYKLVASH